MSCKNIVFQAESDGIATLTVQRLDKMNAIDSATMAEIGSVFEQAERDSSIKALIVTGAGDRAFVAGADIAELAGMSPLRAAALSADGQRVFRQLERMRKPSVAAINGVALGAGLELAMCCSLRVAADTARLGLPEVKLGLIPGYGGTQRLPRLIGQSRAMELLLTGDMIDAAEAVRIGLVNRVTTKADLLAEARRLAAKIVSNGPVAVGLVMEAVDAGFSAGLDQGLRFESAAFGVAASTEDRTEGTRAFLEKRAPAFTGK